MDLEGFPANNRRGAFRWAVKPYVTRARRIRRALRDLRWELTHG